MRHDFPFIALQLAVHDAHQDLREAIACVRQVQHETEGTCPPDGALLLAQVEMLCTRLEDVEALCAMHTAMDPVPTPPDVRAHCVTGLCVQEPVCANAMHCVRHCDCSGQTAVGRRHGP
jgi:hypothetical protein